MVAGRTIRVIAATHSNQVYEILRRCDNVKYDIAHSTTRARSRNYSPALNCLLLIMRMSSNIL
jgi:hypothetical protein